MLEEVNFQTGSALNEPDKLRDSETDSAGLMRLLIFIFFPLCVIQGPIFYNLQTDGQIVSYTSFSLCNAQLILLAVLEF